MPWIRIDTAMKNDPRIGAVADAVDRDVAAVVGHLTCLLAELPQHARDGNLRGTSNSTLETWAMWTGPRGAFATAFREHMMDGDVVRSWEKHNGSSLRELDKKRDDQRVRREAAKAARLAAEAAEAARRVADSARVPTTTPERSAHSGGNVGATVAPTVAPTFPERGAPTVTVTENGNGVLRTNSEEERCGAGAAPTLAIHPAHAPRAGDRPAIDRPAIDRPADAQPGRRASTPTYPHFGKPECDYLFKAWLEAVGAVQYGEFRKALGPLFTRDRDFDAWDAYAAITAFAAAREASDPRGAAAMTVRTFASDFPRWRALGAGYPRPAVLAPALAALLAPEEADAPDATEVAHAA